MYPFKATIQLLPYVVGLYCKDPDTGHLYPVNSTWQSKTFCGNYTCKLRKKDGSQPDYRPIPEINITAGNLQKNEFISNNMLASPSEQSANVMNNVEIKQSDFHKDLINGVNELTNENKNDLMDNNDRYLTEAEIKIITEMLHTVKKSDLEAIVDIYNLAQDIYKEMYTTTTEKLGKETRHNHISDKNEVKAKFKSNSYDSVSYWYEPLHHHNLKTKPTDSIIEETNLSPVIRSHPHPKSYFKGPLTEKDFAKLPYYYPLSNFQRMSSYLHSKSPYMPPPHVAPPHVPPPHVPPPHVAPPHMPPPHVPPPYVPPPHVPPPHVPPPTDHRPCNKQLNNALTQSWHAQQIPPKRVSSEIRNQPRAVHPMQPMLLPYPFSYVNHYNLSSYPASFYYSNYPWAQLDVYNRHKNSAYRPQMSQTEVIVNNEELEKKIEDAHKTIDDDKVVSFENDGDNRVAEWQTEQLSTNILEEVKANIFEKSKLLRPLTLRKNTKLEKVGKLINLDELLRPKRNLNAPHKINDNSENSLFEAYIERKTCESSVEPGFFRIGNESEPFPACCPQMIKKDDEDT